MAKREKVQDFKIDRATSGDGAAVVAAPAAGFMVRVLGYTIIAGGAVNATWATGPTSGATAKSGALPLAANTGASPAVGDPDGGARQFQGGDGEAVYLNLSASVQVSGHGTYQVLRTGAE